MKRILLCTFMLCCCISSLFADSWTDENGVGWDFQLNGNEATISCAYNYGTEVTVPEKVKMEWPDGNGNSVIHEYTVTRFGINYDGYFYGPVFGTGQENITKVILPSTIKLISDYAFMGCSSLTNVGGLSNCISIGNYAFMGCSSLTNVGGLSNCISIGVEAFYGCSALTSVGDLSNCTSIGVSAFMGCSALTSVGDLSNCTSIGGSAFSGCSALTSVGDLSNCTSIGGSAFSGCSALTSVGDLSNCTSIGASAFSGCSSLTNIDLSSCEIIRKGTFYRCESLKSIDLSSCIEIESGELESGESAFCFCSSLTSVYLPKCTKIGRHAFSSCTSLHTVSIPSCTYIGYDIFYDLFNEAGLNIKEITLNSTTPPTLANVETLGKYAMFRVPASALSAYYNDPIWSEPELKNRLITIDDVIDYDVETSAQSAEPGLGRKIDKDDMRKVVTLKVSGTINSYDIIAMNNKMINLRQLDLSDATIVGCNHEYYTGYTTSDNIVGNRMFYDHDKYLSIKLPKNAERIDAEAFAHCNNLKEVELYEGIKSIGSRAFRFCI